MHWIFKQKDGWLDQPFVKIERIMVEPAIAHSELDYDLPLYVGDFVRTAIEDKWYVGAELPENAQAFSDLWTYRGKIESNGHAFYGGNTGDDIEAWRRAADLLGQMGQSAYKENLDAFIAFEPEHSERIAELPVADETHYAPYCVFNDRLRSLDEAGPGLTSILREWLLEQDWVVIDEGAPSLYRDGDVAIPPHPLAERRKDAHRKLHAPDLEAGLRLLSDRLRRTRD